MGYRVAIAGASGYAGGELLRLVAAHPDLDVVAVTAHGNAGQPVGEVHPHLRSLADLTFAETSPAAFAGADLVLPRPAARRVGRVRRRSCRPSRRSSTSAPTTGWPTRTPTSATTAASHAGAWTYGLPELPGQRDAIADADRVANTGCYAVATILALAPLIAAGIAEPTDVVVVAASGTSGAGRSPQVHLLGSEVDGRPVRLQGRRAPARAGDQAGQRRDRTCP